MNEYKLLINILSDIHTYPTGSNREKITCETYNLTKPYTYMESIGVAIIKLHNGEEIEEMKRQEDLFKTSNAQLKFILSGPHVSYSAYNRFKYAHTDDSISKFVYDIPR